MTLVGPATLQRGAIHASSTGGRISFSAGTKHVFITLPAAEAMRRTEILAALAGKAAAFVELSDTPATIEANKFFAGNDGGDALEFKTDAEARALLDMGTARPSFSFGGGAEAGGTVISVDWSVLGVALLPGEGGPPDGPPSAGRRRRRQVILGGAVGTLVGWRRPLRNPRMVPGI